MPDVGESGSKGDIIARAKGEPSYYLLCLVIFWLPNGYLHILALQFLASTLQGLEKDVLIPAHSKRHPTSPTIAPSEI